jgi:hypothetical protein
MFPMHTITSRRPTAEERAVIEHQVKPDAASYGCLTVMFGIGPVVLLALAGGWVAGFVAPAHVATGRWIGAAAGIAVFLAVLVTFIPFERRQRRRAAGDVNDMAVQDIEVRDPRVLEIGLINDTAPILAFDIGDGKLLFLQGQWLVDDVSLYDAPPLKGDAYEDYFNGLPPPHSFPSRAFTLTRLPHSGRVLKIRVAGEYCRPEREVEALRPEYEFGDSELLDGALDEIAHVLAREHARRFSATE